MFTRGVKINYITVRSNPNTPPALPGHVSCVASLATHTHQTSPAGSPVAGCDDDDDSGPQLWSSAGCCSSLWAAPASGCKSLFIILPTSGLQALKDKRCESKQASEACYSRDLGITKIIHEHNITEAVHGEKRRWFFPPPSFKCPSQPPLHHIR